MAMSQNYRIKVTSHNASAQHGTDSTRPAWQDRLITTGGKAF
jgi:hypothetical protein